ncbi:MAG: TIGR03118 family protein [Chloroflexota bacterium]
MTAEIGNSDFAGDAIFKGLAIGSADVGNGSQQYIYATDFHNRRVVVFDRTFAPQTWGGAFMDPHMYKGYAPFGIQTVGTTVFVTFAKTQAGSNDEQAGNGRGVVDAFGTDGTFLGRVASHGLLNAPWGLAMAPADFGRLSNDLLVGNFGDGKINAFGWDGKGWRPDGVLESTSHSPLRIDGLWAIAFGGGSNVGNNGPANALFFAAGPNEENGGAFGTITAAP